MASKWVKVSDSGIRVIVDSKRKRVSQIIKGSNRTLAVRPTPLLNKTGKRKRDESCKSNCRSSSEKTILKNYSNFMKSGAPQRLLFSQYGQWNDFSQDVIDLVKKDFSAKKSAIEVKSNGRHLMLDFLRMTAVDLETGKQKPIAWIDETGSCFFPEIYSSYESHQCNKSEALKDLEGVEVESSMTPEIKLHVEIELNGLSNNSFEEYMDESNVQESNIKRVKVDQEGYKTNENNLNHSENRLYAFPTFSKTVDPESVKNMFIKGININPSLKIDVIDVKKCSGGIMEARLEIFQKQVEITQKLRGKANVQYAWFASPTDAPCGAGFHGLGHDGPKHGRFGYGVHFTAVDSVHNSVITCDVDEKGVRRMILCCVILGNMELVLPGSKQFYPSDESFDSGVDNLQNPNHFVIWNMNMNTHIYPEYEVSFKMSPSAEDGNKVDLSSKVTTQDPLQIDPSPIIMKSGPQHQCMNGMPVEKAPNVGSSKPRDPNSPWLPFTKLFEAISDKVAPNDIKQLHILYESFKAKKTSRKEFIGKLRSIVGVKILRSTIQAHQSKA